MRIGLITTVVSLDRLSAGALMARMQSRLATPCLMAVIAHADRHRRAHLRLRTILQDKGVINTLIQWA